MNKFQTLRDHYVFRLPPRAANPYLTHIPILLAVARWRPITTTLELGCGDISTGAFLDYRYFPELKQLDSYENDSTWAERIDKQFGGDSRLNLHFVKSAICDAVSNLDLERFDLIFVDDSTKSAERSATISAIASRRPKRAVVVIHDFEYYPYRQASAAFRHRFRFTGLSPNTGLLWNDCLLNTRILRRFNRTLRDCGEKADVDEWAATLRTASLHCEPSPFDYSSTTS